jgi:hypothetical protein
MSEENFYYSKVGPDYERITQPEGVRTTVCKNRYEVLASPTAEVSEQQAVQQLREWIRERNAKVMQGTGRVSE